MVSVLVWVLCWGDMVCVGYGVCWSGVGFLVSVRIHWCVLVLRCLLWVADVMRMRRDWVLLLFGADAALRLFISHCLWFSFLPRSNAVTLVARDVPIWDVLSAFAGWCFLAHNMNPFGATCAGRARHCVWQCWYLTGRRRQSCPVLRLFHERTINFGPVRATFLCCLPGGSWCGRLCIDADAYFILLKSLLEI